MNPIVLAAQLRNIAHEMLLFIKEEQEAEGHTYPELLAWAAEIKHLADQLDPPQVLDTESQKA
jgi:hypothetical protein